MLFRLVGLGKGAQMVTNAATRVCITVALLAVAGSVAAEMYKVTVRRIDKDLYRTSEGVYI